MREKKLYREYRLKSYLNMNHYIMTVHFNDDLKALLRDSGGELVSLEGSEAPTRSYIVSHRNEEEFIEHIGRIQSQQISGIVNYVVDQIVAGKEESW